MDWRPFRTSRRTSPLHCLQRRRITPATAQASYRRCLRMLAVSRTICSHTPALSTFFSVQIRA